MKTRAETSQTLVRKAAKQIEATVGNIATVIEGKDDAIRLSLNCLISGGHLLIEDVPGVGKTMLAKALAKSTSCVWRRIQFTPDLLAGDVTGVSIYDRTSGKFKFVHGAIFANLVLGDEINRASPKTQSALLEAMEERQVTVDGNTYPLIEPFMVMATQNPLEHEGIYPLPQSQIDRFTMRIRIGYPSKAKEIEILDTHGADNPVERLIPVISSDEVVFLIGLARRMHVSEGVKHYIVEICNVTRRRADVQLGASPRAALFLLRTARARALMDGREFVLPDDVKGLAVPVLAHRLVMTPEAEMRSTSPDEVVEEALAETRVPAER